MLKINALYSLVLAASFASVQAHASAMNVTPADSTAQSSTAKSAAIQTGGMSDADYEKLFPVIQQKDLVKSLHKKSVVVVDVNGTDSYAAGHIPGAIDFNAAGDKFADMLPKKKGALIVAYCGGPGCQAWRKAAGKLHELGYTNVRHYKGGISEWKSSGRPVEKA